MKNVIQDSNQNATGLRKDNIKFWYIAAEKGKPVI